MTRFKIRAPGAMTLALILSTGFLIASANHSAAEETRKAPISAERSKEMGERSEERITRLHDRLKITAAQEDKWTPVAHVMRENAAAFRTSMLARPSDKDSESAVDHLKSFQIIADQHADGLRKLVPVFTTLYDTLTSDQKKTADTTFGPHQRGGKGRRSIEM